MIQDIAPHHYDNAYRPVPPQPEDYILYFNGNEALLKMKDGVIDFPRFRDLETAAPSPSDPISSSPLYTDAVYLFQIDEQRFYLIHDLNTEDLPDFSMAGTQTFRNAEPQYLAFAGITAHQLYQWYGIRRYCGRCGSPMRHDTRERMMYCETCHNAEYPKLSPAVIIGLTHKNRLLLSKYAGRSYAKYALLAGFVEIGETIEETVKREVMEEVGLPVKNIRYYKSQPWSFSSSVLMGFYCDLDGDDETITLDENELALAQWFQRDEIPVKPSRDSLTNEMIMTFVHGKEPR